MNFIYLFIYFFRESCLALLSCYLLYAILAANQRLCSKDIEKIRGEDSWTSEYFHIFYAIWLAVYFCFVFSNFLSFAFPSEYFSHAQVYCPSIFDASDFNFFGAFYLFIWQVLNHLLYLMRVANSTVQRRVAVALAHLCTPSDGKTIFIDNNGSYYIVHNWHLLSRVEVTLEVWFLEISF